MTTPRRWWRRAVTGLAALAVAATASAAVQWYEHYERGLQHEQNERWAAAVDELKEAARLAPVPRRRVNTYGQNYLFDYDPYVHLTRCHLELGQVDSAELALAQSERGGVTASSVHERLRERLGTARSHPPASPSPAQAFLTISSAPPGTVFVDDKPLESFPGGPLALAPGAHIVRVEGPGREPLDRSVVLEPGQTLSLDLGVPPVAAAAPQADTPVAEPTFLPPTPTPPSPTLAPAPTSVKSAPLPAHPTAAARPEPVAVAAPVALLSPGPGDRPPGPIGLSRLGLLVLAGGGVLAWLVAFLLRRRGVPEASGGPTRIVPGETTQVESRRRIGPYELHETLGRGGMATTYRATRQHDGATLAVKIPHEGCLQDEGFRNRFLREGQLGQELHHPNIVRILDAGEESDRLFLAMELLHGRTLKEELRTIGALPLGRAVEIARDVAEALDYAHAKGIIHRDLKPENIMVLPDGAIKVMDFGIARVADQTGLTGTNFFLGTPLYAAPESVDARHVDHRADLYALGIILFEMLQGTPPFVTDSPFRLLEMHLRQPLPEPASLPRPVPPRVWAMIARLCEKDRGARYPSAAALLVDLNRFVHDLPRDDA